MGIQFKKDLLTIISNIKLCLKYPFLYPRNRFTGLHYNNWKYIGYARTLLRDSCKWNTNPCCSRIVLNWPKYIIATILLWVHDHPMQWIHCIPSYTELDAMPEGWRNRFGLHMCGEIKRALLNEGGKKALYNYRIVDIKEKWGYLHWYDAWTCEKVQHVIMKYEDMSRETCIKCGKKAKYRTTGWICPYCENCIDKSKSYEIM